MKISISMILFYYRVNIDIEFKIISSGGIMLYVIDRRKIDFIFFIMKDGYFVFFFNCGFGVLNFEID